MTAPSIDSPSGRFTQVASMNPTSINLRATPFGHSSGRGALLFAAALLALLSGCSADKKLDPFTTSSVVADDYRITHPITMQERTISLAVPVSAYDQKLTDSEKRNVAFFVQNFLASGATLVGVAVPSGSSNQASAARIASEIQGEFAGMGIPASAVRKGSYAADSGDDVAPVKLAYRAIVAATDPCGEWPDLVTSSEQNRHFHNYGCATQQNLAAEVEDPLDLEYPRGVTPPDAARRAAVLLKYRAGDSTAGSYNETGGTVASGVGQ